MGSRNNPGVYDCFSKAHPDEPTFVLLGRDPQAPGLVRTWAKIRLGQGESAAKIAEALRCAKAMEAWADAEHIAAGKMPESIEHVDEVVRPDTATALANLRHAYAQLHAGSVRYQREFAVGLIGPAIEALEAVLAGSTPTAPSATEDDWETAEKSLTWAEHERLRGHGSNT